jgi:hypothetical protein
MVYLTQGGTLHNTATSFLKGKSCVILIGWNPFGCGVDKGTTNKHLTKPETLSHCRRRRKGNITEWEKTSGYGQTFATTKWTNRSKILHKTGNRRPVSPFFLAHYLRTEGQNQLPILVSFFFPSAFKDHKPNCWQQQKVPKSEPSALETPKSLWVLLSFLQEL